MNQSREDLLHELIADTAAEIERLESEGLPLPESLIEHYRRLCGYAAATPTNQPNGAET